MWSKSIRTVLVILIYNEIFLLDYPQNIKNQIASIQREYKLEINDDELEIISAQLAKYLTEKIKLEEILTKHIASWDKTFDLIKAMLFTAILELQTHLNSEAVFEQPENIKPIVSKYIHLSQDIVGGNNPGLIHAVLLAYIESKSISTQD